MSSVIVEADRGGSGPLGSTLLFDQHDGATRIWMISLLLPPDIRIGLHRHGGDEIWRVRRGRIRMVVGDERVECTAGQLVVLPPNTSHGIMNLDDDTEVEVIGELDMGEWVTVIDPEGSRTEVEAHVASFPWHRPAPEGMPPTSMEEMLAMLQSTAHLL